MANTGRLIRYDEYKTLRGSCDVMIRFYRLMLCKDLQYTFKGYFLEASSATSEALRLSHSLDASAYLCVQQVDVTTSDFHVSPLLRVDGLRT